MARKRMEEPSLTSWEEVDSALKKIVEAQIQLDMIEADMNGKLADIKEQAENEANPVRDVIKKYELQIKEYTAANKVELKGKSKEMTFGTVGFRLSSKIILPKAIEPVIDALKRNKMLDCILTKETVSKDILKTYSPEAILLVGGSVKTEDTFWYDTNREELAQAK